MEFKETVKRCGIVMGLSLVGVYLLGLITNLLTSSSDLGVALGLVLSGAVAVGLIASGVQYGRAVLKAIGLLAIVFFIGACGCERIGPGYVGVMVDMTGTNRGVLDTPVVTGWVFTGPNQQVYEFPTFIQRYPWTQTPTEGSEHDESITFNAKGGVSMTADVAIALKFEEARIPEIFVTFKVKPEAIIDGWVHDRVRDAMNDAAAKYEAVEILSSGKEAFMKDAADRLRPILDARGIKLDSLSLLGSPRPPQNIAQAINAVIEQTQASLQAVQKVAMVKAQADQQAAQADGQRRALVAEAEGRATATLTEAKAQAEANRLLSDSLSTNLIQYRMIDKWNGTVPTTSLGGATPLIQLPTKGN